MSEDGGVKAPVTRLRRRLSVETEDAKSPAGTTPTKKKGGRLATKPQLDLIVENDVEQVPKRSAHKTATKDVVETVNDKPMTPSRRSARIKSNTSIISETTQSLDSPRAKRAAARRTSQAGSDNDGPVTPARQTRRTRKDSTSSVDKPGEKPSNKTSATPEVIVEEQETNNDISSARDNSISTSPKGRGRKGKKNSISPSANDKDETENDKDIAENKNLDTSNKKDKQEVSEDSSKSVVTTSTDNNENDEIGSKNTNYVNIESSDIVSEYIDEKPKERNTILHKSTSAIEDSKSFKSKRHRTKSGSTLLRVDADTSNECNFFSDNEIYKKKKKDKSLNISNSKSLLSGNEILKNKNNNSLTKLHNTSKEGGAQSTDTNIEVKGELINDIEAGLENPSENMEVNDKSMVINNESANNSFTKTGWKKNIINQIENMIDFTAKTDPISHMTYFIKEPSKDIKPVIIIEEDSDSNAGNNGPVHPAAQLGNGDQCVPVVKHSVHNDDEKLPADKSYEPMDIDESINHSQSIIQSMKNSPRPSQQLETQNQFSVSIEQNNDYFNVTSNKSKRKSSLLSSELHNLEKSSNENRSTLILSQMKDTSGSEINVTLPKVENKEQLSRSVNNPDKLKNKDTGRKKFSLDYSTSTPLQQKSMKKLGVSIDTSLISPKTNPTNKKNSVKKDESIEKSENSSSEKENEISKDEFGDDLEESDDSREEVTKTQNEVIDDEAEEASEDYQSGDSQNEDERQYEEENEIVEKGETLDTDEEFSDDTDYEKDSFVVSSNEEDNELLSGSSDDLSLNDNELSMSAKSKKKYNERKIKEQKKASREMYEARHEISNKDVKKTKYKKNSRQRLDSSSSESDEEQAVQARKPNRQRIDSSQELSDEKTDESKSVMKKKKRNRLSESICSESGLNEKEITVCNESKIETDDPISVAIKHEPRTPQKNSILSAIVINDNIEEVNIDPNATMVNPNETSDPLQATIQESDEDSEPSEDNQEIINNYNSVLENLNTNSKANKKHNISLNINKKQKKVKEPIVDQLNLTQTKPKKAKNKSAETSLAPQRLSQEEKKLNEKSDDGEESDSINMQLLFTEDSNDSVPNTDKNKSEIMGEVKDYIPLKKTEAKTNLLESMDISTEIDSSSNLNESKRKKKTQTSSQHIQIEDSSLLEGDNNEGSFFIDTTGTRFDVDKPVDTSKSSSKKKKKRTSVCETTIVEVETLPVDDVESVVNKTPKKSLNGSDIVTVVENITEEDAPVQSTNSPLSAKKKKKGKKSFAATEEEIDTQNDNIDDTNNIEKSFFIDTVGTRFNTDETENTSSKKKKNRNSTCDSKVIETDKLLYENDETIGKKTPKKSLNSTTLQVDAEKNIADETADMSNTLGSTKKNKKAKKSLTVAAEETEIVNGDAEQDEPAISIKAPQSAKKKKNSLSDESTNKSVIQVQEEVAVAVMTPQSGKKKNKLVSLDESMNKYSLKEQDELEGAVHTPQSGKKKNKSVLLDKSINKSTVEEQNELVVAVKTPQSGKKKNKSLVLDQSMNKSTIEAEKGPEIDFIIMSSSGKKKPKDKKSLNITQNASVQIEEINDVPTEVVQKSDKKRKSSQSNLETPTVIPLQYSKSEDEGDAPLEISYRSDKTTKSQLETQESEDMVTKENSLNTSSNSAKKKKQKSVWNISYTTNETEEINEVNIDQSREEDSSIKRKRKHSATVHETMSLENDNEEKYASNKLNESTTGNQRKKRKLADNMPEITTLSTDRTKKDTNEISNAEALGHKKLKKNKHVVKQHFEINEKETAKVNQNKKRKERDDDIMTNVSKILKQDSMNKAHVTRLPSHILNQLEDKPNKHIPGAKKTKVIATTEFQVEETKVKRNKPSCYLEESVYLNETLVEKNTKKYSIKNPKVLPFIPTASTSDSGFTTNFRINLLPRETQFVAQATNVVNFKNDFLQQQKIKKFRTFEKYKNQRNVKISKF